MGEPPTPPVADVLDDGGEVDGLVLCGPRSSVAALAEQTTLVLMNRTVSGIRAVSADNVQVALTAVGHLRALGHRRIAYAGGPNHSWSDARRHEGLQQCVEQFGDIEVVDLGHFRPHHSGGVAAADLALASGATAVVAFNDLMIRGDSGASSPSESFSPSLPMPVELVVRQSTAEPGGAGVGAGHR